MKYRIRMWLGFTMWPVIALVAFNHGHTTGLRDMEHEFNSVYGSTIESIASVQ